jgi:hypothetical protein
VRRRVRQHDGDSDLEGIPGWCVEVKRHAQATRAHLRGWWQQATEQAGAHGLKPALFYRRDRDEWRAVWAAGGLLDYAATVESSPATWAALAGLASKESSTEGGNELV